MNRLSERIGEHVPLAAWAAYFFPKPCKPSRLHLDMYEAEESDSSHNVFIAPRDSGKSTVNSQDLVAYELLEGTAEEIVVGSYSQDLIIAKLSRLKVKLELDPWIRENYPEQKPGDTWGKEEMRWQRKPITPANIMPYVRLTPRGSKQQITGERIGKFVGDDIEDPKLAHNAELRIQNLEWFREVVSPAVLKPEEGGRITLLGTTHVPDCFIMQFDDNPSYQVKKYPALNELNESYWPARWPLEALLRKKDEIGERAFSAQYMLDPYSDDSLVFDRDWFRYYRSDDAAFLDAMKKGTYTVVGVDPAISEKDNACFSAVVTVTATIEERPKYYIRNGGVRRGRGWTVYRLVEEAVKCERDFDAAHIAVESNNYQKSVCQVITRYAEDKRITISALPITSDVDKVRRARDAMETEMQRGQMFFDVSDPMIKRLVDEMKAFPSDASKDFVDALGVAMMQAKRRAKAGVAKTPQSSLTTAWSE